MKIIPLQPHYQYRLWGGDRLKRFGFYFDEVSIGEAWTASALPQGSSVVSAGPYAGTPLGELYNTHRELFGIDASVFPLLIKWIDPNDDLSIQVHPDDELAQSLEGQRKDPDAGKD